MCVGGGGGGLDGWWWWGGMGGGDLRPPSPVIFKSHYACYRGLVPSVLV